MCAPSSAMPGGRRGNSKASSSSALWITKKPVPMVANLEDCDQLWAELLCSMGPWYRLLADTPDDPSLN